MSEQARLIANIERFGQLGGIMTGKEPCGDWVRYTDHVAEVTRLIDEIARVNRRVDEEAETDRITAERNAARAEVERLEAEVERLTVERDAAYISIESLRNALAEQDHELDMAREDVLRLTSERDAAQAEAERLRGETQRAVEAEREACASLFDRPVWAYDYREIAARIRARRLIAERDQPESRPKGREVGRFGLDGHYLYGMEPARPTDEDIWREGFKRQMDEYRKQWGWR